MLLLLGVTFVTLSDHGGHGGVFAKARSYAREVLNPVQSGIHSALQPVGDFLYGALEYRSLEHENQLLRQQLAADQADAAQAQAAQLEAQQVLAEEHLGYLGNIRSVAAQVVDVTGSNFEETVTIDRGAANGIVVGQPVVSADGLVGSVTSASSHLAVVTLLDDPSFTVGVRVVNSGVVGAAVGEGLGNTEQVIDIDAGQKVKAGDDLVTSGLSIEHFPAGLPVGRVTKVLTPTGALQLEVSMQPFVDLNNLQYVRVLLWSAQGGG
ncbi:MAG TPA: rod shape-determining protein MreC [Acidimicrobiales bacterium]|nr:rod shape-determining protein MreC [Acidimicrobiales bacterium]